jgi:hypothetical protein
MIYIPIFVADICTPGNLKKYASFSDFSVESKDFALVKNFAGAYGLINTEGKNREIIL